MMTLAVCESKLWQTAEDCRCVLQSAAGRAVVKSPHFSLKDTFPSASIKQWMGKALRDGVYSVPPFLLLSRVPAAVGPWERR